MLFKRNVKIYNKKINIQNYLLYHFHKSKVIALCSIIFFWTGLGSSRFIAIELCSILFFLGIVEDSSKLIALCSI